MEHMIVHVVMVMKVTDSIAPRLMSAYLAGINVIKTLTANLMERHILALVEPGTSVTVEIVKISTNVQLINMNVRLGRLALTGKARMIVSI